MKNLKWRLGKLPTPDEVRELVKDKIITQEEARTILFTEQDSDEKDTKELTDEVEFLRNLVDKLCRRDVNSVITYVREYPRPNYPWYQPYSTWCNSLNSNLALTQTGQLASLSSAISGTGGGVSWSDGTNIVGL
jgi:hypothetical protein